MIPFLLQGLTLGLSAALTPGPFQAYLFSESVRRGWRRAWLYAFAPLVSDGPIIAVLLLALAQVPTWLVDAIRLVGGGYLIWLANRISRAAGDTEEQAGVPATANLVRAALVNASSPGPYLFWGLLAGPILLAGWRASPPYGLSFLLGFYGTLIGGSALLVAFFSAAGRSKPGLRSALIRVGAWIMLGFGLYQIGLGLLRLAT